MDTALRRIRAIAMMAISLFDQASIISASGANPHVSRIASTASAASLKLARATRAIALPILRMTYASHSARLIASMDIAPRQTNAPANPVINLPRVIVRTSLCEPICDPSCKNGICVQPDVCSCNPGYRTSASPNNKTNMCDPICHPACEINGICEAPDLCVCKNGYRMIYYDGGDVPFGCEPICGVECGNGTCTAPDLCACFDGYRNAKIGGCEPVCASCGNGTCVAPEVCECDDGFVLAGANLELALLGIEKSRSSIVPENETRNGSRCVPHCENCDNGECEAPGECRCRAGFVKIEDTCVHACQGGCGTHGECVAERRTCECDYGWAGPHCDRPTLCVLILNEEGNRTEQLTIIKEQNATIEHILMNNPACSECIGKVSNETLCFKMLVNGTKSETQIGCLMNEECLALSSQYKDQGKIIKLTSGIAGGILLLTVIIMIYLILRKRQNRQDLGDVQVICRHSTSM